jgi:maltooligosyltrehalose synthase
VVADTKKAATIRNLWYTRVARPLEQANGVVTAIRDAIVNNSLAGEFSQAERDAMMAVETNLQALAALPGVTQAAGKYRPNHATEQEPVGLEV